MKEKFTARRILAGLLFFGLVGGAAALYWHKDPEPMRLETFAMGSYMQQSLWGGEETAAQEASGAVAALENEISWRRQGSIAQLNQAAGGGVVANGYLREKLTLACEKAGLKLVLPAKHRCTDNAAMIACEGLIQYRAGNFSPLSLNACPSIPLR